MAQYADPNNPSFSIEGHRGTITRSSWILLVAALVAVGFTGAFWYQSVLADKQTSDLDARSAQDQAGLASLSAVAQNIAALDTQGTGLRTVLTNQKKWEDVLSNIQAHLYKRMVVTNLDLTDDGSVNLSGLTDGFTSYAALYASLTSTDAQNYFTDVRPVSVIRQDNSTGLYPDIPKDAVAFSFSLKLTPAMFQPPISAN